MSLNLLDIKELLKKLHDEDWDGLLKQVPELNTLVGLYQGKKYHYADAWTHTKHVVKAVKLLKHIINGETVSLDFEPHPESGFHALLQRTPLHPRLTMWVNEVMGKKGDRMDRWDVLLLAALLHDIGKPDTAEDVGDGLRVHFIGHEEVGARKLENFNVSPEYTADWQLVIELVRHHIKPILGFSFNRPSEKFVPEIPENEELRVLLMLLAIADITASKASDRFAEYRTYFNELGWFWLFFERPVRLVDAAANEWNPLIRFNLLHNARKHLRRVPTAELNEGTLGLHLTSKGRNRIRVSEWLWRKLNFLMADPVRRIRFEAGAVVGLISLKSNAFRNKLMDERIRPKAQAAAQFAKAYLVDVDLDKFETDVLGELAFSLAEDGVVERIGRVVQKVLRDEEPLASAKALAAARISKIEIENGDVRELGFGDEFLRSFAATTFELLVKSRPNPLASYINLLIDGNLAMLSQRIAELVEEASQQRPDRSGETMALLWDFVDKLWRSEQPDVGFGRAFGDGLNKLAKTLWKAIDVLPQKLKSRFSNDLIGLAPEIFTEVEVDSKDLELVAIAGSSDSKILINPLNRKEFDQILGYNISPKARALIRTILDHKSDVLEKLRRIVSIVFDVEPPKSTGVEGLAECIEVLSGERILQWRRLSEDIFWDELKKGMSKLPIPLQLEILDFISTQRAATKPKPMRPKMLSKLLTLIAQKSHLESKS